MYRDVQRVRAQNTDAIITIKTKSRYYLLLIIDSVSRKLHLDQFIPPSLRSATRRCHDDGRSVAEKFFIWRNDCIVVCWSRWMGR